MADEGGINEDTSLLRIAGNKDIHENDDKNQSSILNLGYIISNIEYCVFIF